MKLDPKIHLFCSCAPPCSWALSPCQCPISFGCGTLGAEAKIPRSIFAPSARGETPAAAPREHERECPLKRPDRRRDTARSRPWFPGERMRERRRSSHGICFVSGRPQFATIFSLCFCVRCAEDRAHGRQTKQVNLTRASLLARVCVCVFARGNHDDD